MIRFNLKYCKNRKIKSVDESVSQSVSQSVLSQSRSVASYRSLTILLECSSWSGLGEKT
jgi:hypothetical protein